MQKGQCFHKCSTKSWALVACRLFEVYIEPSPAPVGLAFACGMGQLISGEEVCKQLSNIQQECQGFWDESDNLIQHVKQSVRRIEKLHASKHCEMGCDELREAELEMRQTSRQGRMMDDIREIILGDFPSSCKSGW